jgi:type III restriction enzyme
VILDSDWEARFCRVAESHPRVKAYVKNHGLGLEVPYRYGSEARTYLTDFIRQVDDGREDPLNLIIEVKGYRRDDAKEKELTMESCWAPGVNNLSGCGRWASAGLTDVFIVDADFTVKLEGKFNKMIYRTTSIAVQETCPRFD